MSRDLKLLLAFASLFVVGVGSAVLYRNYSDRTWGKEVVGALADLGGKPMADVFATNSPDRAGNPAPDGSAAGEAQERVAADAVSTPNEHFTTDLPQAPMYPSAEDRQPSQMRNPPVDPAVRPVAGERDDASDSTGAGQGFPVLPPPPLIGAGPFAPPPPPSLLVPHPAAPPDLPVREPGDGLAEGQESEDPTPDEPWMSEPVVIPSDGGAQALTDHPFPIAGHDQETAAEPNRQSPGTMGPGRWRPLIPSATGSPAASPDRTAAAPSAWLPVPPTPSRGVLGPPDVSERRSRADSVRPPVDNGQGVYTPRSPLRPASFRERSDEPASPSGPSPSAPNVIAVSRPLPQPSSALTTGESARSIPPAMPMQPPIATGKSTRPPNAVASAASDSQRTPGNLAEGSIQAPIYELVGPSEAKAVFVPVDEQGDGARQVQFVPAPPARPAPAARLPEAGGIAASAPPVAVQSYDVETYIVLAGDTFETIAKSTCGSVEYAPALIAYNRSTAGPGDPLPPNQRVAIPPVAVLERELRRLDVIRAAQLGFFSPPSRPVARSSQPEVRSDRAPAPASVPEAAPGEGPIYTVLQEQDTLFGIARRTLGDGNRWREIYRLNADRLDNEYHLPIGTKLRLPAGAKLP